MNCLSFEDQIAQYVDGGLDLATLHLVEAHLRCCPACAEFADQLEYDRILLRMPPPETAEVDFVALRRQIRQRIVEERRHISLVPVLLVAASILMAAGIAAIRFGASRMPTPQPPVALLKGTVVNSGADPLVRGRRPRRPFWIQPDVHPMAKSGSGGTHADQGVRPTVAPTPQADPGLEAALQEFLAAEKPPPVSPDTASPIEIRIVTGDPNVVLILLKETSGESNE